MGGHQFFNLHVGAESIGMYPPSVHCNTCIIVGDNWDKTINPRFMTLEHQRKSLHYFHFYTVFDRIDFSHLSREEPIGDVEKLPLSVYIPDADECSVLRDNYATLLSRVLVEEVDYFKKFCSKFVVQHIPHNRRGHL